MGIRLVTTCHADGWREYGRRMVETFVQHWPAAVTLDVYAEGFDLDVAADNVNSRRLPDWHTDWKARHAGNADAHGRDKSRFGRADKLKRGDYSYRRDCVRFSHKVAALTDAALNPNIVNHADLLIMVDADTVTHAPVTIEWLRSVVNPTMRDFYMAWLYRANWYPECGFVVFNETHPAHDWFMRRLRATYESGEVFAFSETHDSFVLQELVKCAVSARRFPTPISLSGNAGERSTHPFVHSRLAERLDHAKGKFKRTGRTPAGLGEARHRPEPYWKV